MALSDQAVLYVEQMGIDAAAQKFGKSPQTIRLWLKTKRVPIEVADAMLAEAENTEKEPPPPPENHPQYAEADQYAEEQGGVPEILQQLYNLKRRVRNLENFILPKTNVNPALAPGPVARPVPPSGIVSAQSMTGFTSTARLGADHNPPPQPSIPDPYGAKMSDLLKPLPKRPESKRTR